MDALPLLMHACGVRFGWTAARIATEGMTFPPLCPGQARKADGQVRAKWGHRSQELVCTVSLGMGDTKSDQVGRLARSCSGTRARGDCACALFLLVELVNLARA